MREILDLHIHSPYPRACSPQLSLANIDKACRLKGVSIIATGDFTHPDWFASIKQELEETADGSGLYKLKAASDDKLKFILSTEVALIYKDGDRCRRIHLVVHAPNLKAASEFNRQLDSRFNIRSDGRPILGISAPDFVKMAIKTDPRFLVYPAHIWTPWFSVFGSKSGFDSLEECFKEQVGNIYAVETGLSSDPEMNWRLSALDNLSILSNSDAHGLNNIGREANVMSVEAPATYQKIYDSIKNKTGMEFTVEFYPEEGMYHFDGHRDCGFSCEPKESRKLKNICPKCGKPLIIGVMNRVEQLADRPFGFKPAGAPGFIKLVELDKIIAAAFRLKNRNSVKVQKEYARMTDIFGSELKILSELDIDKAGQEIDPRVATGIKNVRSGNISLQPGFDGQYGEINIFASHSKTAG